MHNIHPNPRPIFEKTETLDFKKWPLPHHPPLVFPLISIHSDQPKDHPQVAELHCFVWGR